MSNAKWQRASMRLRWYAGRLAQMSAAEIAHRFSEQAKRLADRSRAVAWSDFGRFDSALAGMPGRDLWEPVLAHDGERAARRAQGRFEFLQQAWPAQDSGWPETIWHLDPVTEKQWPGSDTFAFDVDYRHASGMGDVKFVWEINRLHMLQELAACAGQSRDAWKTIARVLEGWMAANPPCRGLNWTNGIEAASRLASVFATLAFADHAQRETLKPLVLPFVDAHVRWIARYPSLYSSANNHRVAELAALFLASVCVPGLPDADHIRASSYRGLSEEIFRQFHEDGVGAEQSPTYAAYSLEWFVLAGISAQSAGLPFPDSYRRRVAAVVTHFDWLSDDAGHVPAIGDDDEGRVLAPHAESYVASVKELAARWLGMTREAHTGVRTFAEGGYTILREPGEHGTFVLVMDHGPLGYLSIAAHGHADALAVWLHWGEEAIFVDAGTYLYHSGGRERDWFRGTPAHNTLAIGDCDQSRISGPFGWAEHATTRIVNADGAVIAAECDGYERRFGVRHRRRISVDKDGAIAIEDRLPGTPKAAQLTWALGFLVSPDVSVSVSGVNADLLTPAGRRLTLELAGGSGAIWNTTRAPWSGAFNTKRDAVRLQTSGTVSTDPNFAIVTRLRRAK